MRLLYMTAAVIPAYPPAYLPSPLLDVPFWSVSLFTHRTGPFSQLRPPARRLGLEIVRDPDEEAFLERALPSVFLNERCLSRKRLCDIKYNGGARRQTRSFRCECLKSSVCFSLSFSSSSISNREECCSIRVELIRSVIYYEILRGMLLNIAD